MSGNPVAWFEIYVDDLERARGFYEALLQTRLSSLGDPDDGSISMLGFEMDDGQYGASGALVKMAGVGAGGNSTLVYFGCEDCAVEESRVVEAGGRVEQSKLSLGEFGFMVVAIDTEGNRIGLHSMA